MFANAKNKLQTLRVLHDGYYNDKLEFIKIMMENVITKNPQNQSLLKSYLKFRDNQK